MKKRLHSGVRVGMIVLCSFLFVLFCFNQFSKKLEKNLEGQVKQELQNEVSGNADILISKFEDYFIMLEGIAENIEFTFAQGDVAGPLNLLEYAYLGRHFGRIGLMNEDGVFKGADGDYFEITDKSLLAQIHGAERKIFDYDLNGDGNRTISVAVPIRGEENQVWSTLLANVHDSDIRMVLDSQNTEKRIRNYIITDVGEFLSEEKGTEATNIFQLLEGAEAAKGYSLTDFGKGLAKKQEGLVRYTDEKGEEVYMHFKPLGMESWFIVSIVPVNVIEQQSVEISTLAAKLSVEVAAVFLVLGILFILSQRAHRLSILEKEKELEKLTDSIDAGLIHITDFNTMTVTYGNESCYRLLGYGEEEFRTEKKCQLMNIICEENREMVQKALWHEVQTGVDIKLEFPVVRKNGGKAWLSVKGYLSYEEMTLVCVLVDITKNKTCADDLRMTEDKYHMLMNHSTQLQFEYDIVQDRFYPCEAWVRKFGWEPSKENFLLNLPKKDSILEADKAAAQTAIQNIRDGSPFEELEIRLKTIGDRYIWCQVELSSIYDGDNCPVYVMGTVRDIDRRKRRRENTSSEVHDHYLDTLYSKTEVQLLIEDYLKNKDDRFLCAFAVVDIDDFSTVNDKMGQLFGDNVLEDLSAKIKKMFRSSDIIGRIGGDQFVVFIKDLASIKAVEENAANICNIFRISYKGKNIDYRLSGSIGVSLYPEDGTTYESLYQKALMALYASKQKGKDRFGLYKPYMMEVDSKKYLQRKENPQTGPSALDEGSMSDLVKVILFEKDREQAIEQVLAKIGAYYHTSRAYFWEKDSEGEFLVIHEWCNIGIESKRALLLEIGGRNFQNFQVGEYMRNDIFCCSDISRLHMDEDSRKLLLRDLAKSVLYIKVQNQEQVFAYLGLEQCGFNRVWTEEEINALRDVAAVMGEYFCRES